MKFTFPNLSFDFDSLTFSTLRFSLLRKILFVASFLIVVSSGFAQVIKTQEAATSLDSNILQDAEKVLVKLSDLVSLPKQTKLTKIDSSVFFVNSTKDALLTISIDFGKRKAHCSSDNLKWFADEGVLRSVAPIAPKDFVIMCFPESGIYNVSIFGLKQDGSAAITQVVVP